MRKVMFALAIAAGAFLLAPQSASAQCSYRMNDVGRPHGYLSGPCNGAAMGYAGAYPSRATAQVKGNGHAGGCDSVCQTKCQGAWRALGFQSVNACVARWAKLNAEGTAATCETAIKANGMRPIRGC